MRSLKIRKKLDKVLQDFILKVFRLFKINFLNIKNYKSQTRIVNDAVDYICRFLFLRYFNCLIIWPYYLHSCLKGKSCLKLQGRLSITQNKIYRLQGVNLRIRLDVFDASWVPCTCFGSIIWKKKLIEGMNLFKRTEIF